MRVSSAGSPGLPPGVPPFPASPACSCRPGGGPVGAWLVGFPAETFPSLKREGTKGSERPRSAGPMSRGHGKGKRKLSVAAGQDPRRSRAPTKRAGLAGAVPRRGRRGGMENVTADEAERKPWNPNRTRRRELTTCCVSGGSSASPALSAETAWTPHAPLCLRVRPLRTLCHRGGPGLLKEMTDPGSGAGGT